MMFHQQLNIDTIQTGAQTLSYSGMQAIKQAKVPLYLVTGSLRGWLETEAKNLFTIIYLGHLLELNRQQNTDDHFWNGLSKSLFPNGVVLCWSSSDPQTPLFAWQRYEGTIRSVHSGDLWIGRI